MKRIMWYIPTRGVPDDEMQRRQKLFESTAGPDTVVVIKMGNGPPAIQSAFDEYQVIPEMCRAAVEAAERGLKAFIIGCADDPGMDALRERVRIPVVGPGASSIHVASLLSDRFSILTTGPRMKMFKPKLWWLKDKLASIRGIGLSVLESREDRDKTLEALIDVGKSAIRDDGANVLTFGCTALGFIDVDKELKEELNVPVVNCVKAAVKAAEMLVDLSLY